VAAMLQDPVHGHLSFAQAQSALNRATLMAADLPAPTLAGFTQEADESLRAQRALEAADTVSFEDFRADYMAARHLVV
jgi:glutamate--cysteine ligase